MAIKKGLGRGLNALLKDNSASNKSEDLEGKVILVSVDRIDKSTVQPRQVFNKDAISDLAKSIKEHGIIQPLLLRADKNRYQLIAGERRLTAAKLINLSEVPAIVIEAKDGKALELALIENIQRENLNVIEEAEAYQMLAEKFKLTQEKISERVGKARASVANTLRLLSLPPEVKLMISSGELSAGHAKILTGLEIKAEQSFFAKKVVKESLSVRNLEKAVQKAKATTRKPRVQRSDVPESHLSLLSEKLHGYFGTQVRIAPSRTFANGKKGKGKIEIDFYSNDDLSRILDLLGISGD